MATMNPLEKKARSSFIKGLLIAGLIGIIVIVILTVQIFKMRGEENQRIASQKNVVIIKQDIKSGEEITSDMLLTVKANSEVASTGAMTMADFSTLSTATDDAGNTANLRVLAKIDISAKTVITEDMLSTEETAVSNDSKTTRIQYDCFTINISRWRYNRYSFKTSKWSRLHCIVKEKGKIS